MDIDTIWVQVENSYLGRTWSCRLDIFKNKDQDRIKPIYAQISAILDQSSAILNICEQPEAHDPPQLIGEKHAEFKATCSPKNLYFRESCFALDRTQVRRGISWFTLT